MERFRYQSVALFVFALSFLLLRPIAHASEATHLLWSDSTQASSSLRHFSEGIRQSGAWILKVYAQHYGDYQELLENHSFADLESVKSYLKTNFPAQRSVEVIHPWPIKRGEDYKKRNTFLWEVKNLWSEDWELRFARWVQNEVAADFFNKNGIATDCADVLVGLRWVFARNNALPVANTLGATGDLFTQNSVLRSWRNYSRDEIWSRDRLFMAALNYIMGVTSTRTLIHDSYPISLTTRGLLAGNFILTIGDESNHVKVLSENHFNDPSEIPLYTLSSTTPRSRKDMVREAMLDEEWPKKGVKSFLALRWPVQNSKGDWYLQSSNLHTNYSLEQYDEDLRVSNPSFIDFLLKRLKPDFSPRKIIEIGVTELKEYLEMRATIVVKGYEYCQSHSCAQGTTAWDDWSTPSRDHKIATKFNNYEIMLGRYEELYPGLLENWKNALKSVAVEILGEAVPLSAIRYIWRENLFSSDPSFNPSKRWGMEYESFFQTALSGLRSLLKERDNLVNEGDNHCERSSCYPKNPLWLSLNSYHLDRDLLRLNSQVRSYCSELATKSCLSTRDSVLGEIIRTSFAAKSALSWINTVSSFSSSPNDSFSKRWGRSLLNSIDLNKLSSIKIGANALALIDSQKLVDLKSESFLGSSLIGERMLLTRFGVAIKTPKKGVTLEILYPQNRDWEQLDLLDLLDESFDWNRATLVDTNYGSVLTMPGEKGYLVLVFNGIQRPKLLALDSNYVNVSSEAILFAAQADRVGLYHLDNGRIFKLIYPPKKIKNPSLLTIMSRASGNLIAQYSDQNEDLYFPVIVDLNAQRLTPIESLAEQSKLIFFNSQTLSGVVEAEFNSEFPRLIGFNLKDLEVVKTTLLGNIVSAFSADHLLVGKGGKWDHDFDRTLYRATSNGWQRVLEDTLGSKLIDLAGNCLLTSKMGGDYGEIINLTSGRKVVSGAQMKISAQLGAKSLLMITGDPHVLLTRYSSYMGDYMGYGEIYQVSEIGAPRLIYTSAYAKRDEEESQLQWEQRFKEFKIYSGTLVSTGVGLTTWIGPIN